MSQSFDGSGEQWSPEEDLLIIALVHKYGTKSWKKLAIDMNARLV